MAFPPRHQEHMYKWSGSQRTPAGNQQRTSDTRKDKKELRGTREDKERQKKKKCSRTGPAPLGGEVSSRAERSAATERELRRLRGERSNRSVTGRTE